MRSHLFYHLRRTSCAALPLLIGAALSLSHPVTARADEATPLPPVSVDTDKMPAGCPLDTTSLDKKQVNAKSILGASDSVGMLSAVPGVSVIPNGGIAGLPIIHGIADDQNSTLVDGVPITSSCPNHMNPAQAYIAPSNVGHVTVISGVSPVSAGGDSIGGTILIDPAAPMFANPGENVAVHGSAGTFFRSNNNEVGTNGDISAATNKYSIGYAGSWERAGDYHDGNDNRVLASSFENYSNSGSLAVRNDNTQVVVRGGHNITPFEGFPNQYMDMLANTSNYLNTSLSGSYGWGSLDGKLYWQNVHHYMNFIAERAGTSNMPMNTNGTDEGYSLKAEIPLDKTDLLRVGNELHAYSLSDWWPPGSAGMTPGTFRNINNGERNVLGTYAELEKKWAPAWTSVFGLRNDTVWMNAGNVNGYDNTYATDAAAFNSQDHHKTDSNFDFTATTRFEASSENAYELGLARKSQSPNLYERYAWSTNGMAAAMVNWYGNAVGYVGNLNLRPQTANTASTSAEWHDAANKDWNVKVTPYYTYVQNYIGVNYLKTDMMMGTIINQFANHDAQIYGFDLSGKKLLLENPSYGNFDVAGTAGLARGQQINNGNSLYHMQPLSADVSLNHRLGGLTNTIEARLVDEKSITDPLQNEPITPGYAILNWRTSYQLENITFAVGIDNILNKQYYDPNAGNYVSDSNINSSESNMALAAPGRSYNAGVTVKF